MIQRLKTYYDQTNRIALTIFYYTFMAPFGLIMRFKIDPLKIKKIKNNSYWQDRTTTDKTMEDVRKLY